MVKRGKKKSVGKMIHNKKKKDDSKIYFIIAIVIMVLIAVSFFPIFPGKVESSDNSGLPTLNAVSFWVALIQIKATSTAISTSTPNPNPGPTDTYTIATPAPNPATTPSINPFPPTNNWPPAPNPSPIPSPIPLCGGIPLPAGYDPHCINCKKDSSGNYYWDYSIKDTGSQNGYGCGELIHLPGGGGTTVYSTCFYGKCYPCPAPDPSYNEKCVRCSFKSLNPPQNTQFETYWNTDKQNGRECRTNDGIDGKCKNGVCSVDTIPIPTPIPGDTCKSRYGNDFVTCPPNGDPNKLQCCYSNPKNENGQCNTRGSKSVCCAPRDTLGVSPIGDPICNPTKNDPNDPGKGSCIEPTPLFCPASTMNTCCPASSTCLIYSTTFLGQTYEYAECGQSQTCSTGQKKCGDFKNGYQCCINIYEECKADPQYNYPICEAKNGVDWPGHTFCPGTGSYKWRSRWCPAGQFCETSPNGGYPMCRSPAV